MKISFAAILVLVLSASALAQTSAQIPAYRIIVHPTNAVSALDRDFVADAFLKKVTRWPNGEPIRPVDLQGSSAVRQHFCEGVLRRTMAAVRSYWQQLIFSGRNIPPPSLESDQAVIAYVLKFPGAIGYVSGVAKVGDAKVVSVR